MRFPEPLIPATLVKRYKRFLADARLADGQLVTAHCANPGSMLGLTEPGAPVWLSPARNPERKLRYTWELVEADGGLVGINTAQPNGLVAEAIADGRIRQLAGYGTLRREVRYGRNSRIDILLEDPVHGRAYVEVKNVHLKRRPGLAEFPDSVTARGAKHLAELADMVAEGHRAIIFFLVQRGDCQRLGLAADIDPNYARAFADATDAGVEALCYSCMMSPGAIAVEREMKIDA
jgi:sugar fermentation stimulation protein A